VSAVTVVALDPGGGSRAAYRVAVHYRTSGGMTACIRAEVCCEADATAGARRMAAVRHPAPGWNPRPASQCEECNPKGNPPPLAVDGREYQRRLRNRRKRGR
jgi:hypothetical protein